MAKNKRIIYKDNIIIDFGSSYHAFVINQDNNVEDKSFTTLESTKQWIVRHEA